MNPHARHLRGLTLAAVILLTLGLALGFLWAPEDSTGFIQKIFYLHVPLAIVSLVGFVVGGLFGAAYLRTGDRIWDMRSYCAIHMALIFSVGGIITGSIWAKADWGHWWLWSEPTLVSYFIVILMFCTYQPLRFSIEDPERQSRYAAVFSIVAGAFVPLNFLAVSLATAFVHPRVLNLEGGNIPGKMKVAFYIAVVGFALLYTALMKFEMLTKTTRIETRRMQRLLLGDDDVRPAARSAAPVA
jgi:heme exporter protein C